MAPDPERKRNLSQVRLKVNGADAPRALAEAIVRVVVDERLHAPTMFEIVLDIEPHDPKWLDDATIAEGKEVEILAGYASEEAQLCIGKVTAVDADLDEKMPTLTVRGYDYSFGLHRDVKSRSFQQQSDSDIATKIAGEAGGLTAKVDATSEVHPYLLQYARTNYDFLLERARRIGHELRVVGKELRFTKPSPNGSPTELEWGVTLKRFRPRLSVAEQVTKVEVRGWDVKEKKTVLGTAETSESKPAVGESRAAGAVASGVWGAATRQTPIAQLVDENDAKAVAQAMLDEVNSSFIQASGECDGNPKLRVGASVKIKGVGTRFSGTYYLTAAQHTITKKHGHQTSFTASTREPSTVSSLLTAPRDTTRVHDVIVGIVTNNKDDEEHLGRVKVKFPTLTDEHESFWARLAVHGAGKDRGFLAMPEVNDEVLVAFEHGDPNRPFVLGGLWNGKDAPPEGTAPLVANDVVNQRIWRSRTGHLFVFDDTDGDEAIRIIDTTTENFIVITSKDGKLQVELKGDIEITSKTGKISVKADKDVSIESTNGKVSLKGVTTEFEAQQGAKIKAGTSYDLQAGTSFKVQASTTAEIQGSVSAKLAGGMVDVQGQSVTNVKGGIVNIN